jgi:hypothetical protein
MSRSARRHAEKFDSIVIARRYLGILRK